MYTHTYRVPGPDGGGRLGLPAGPVRFHSRQRNSTTDSTPGLHHNISIFSDPGPGKS